jgi:hypothetical protein
VDLTVGTSRSRAQRIIVGMSEDKPPRFFIPGCAPEEQDKVYAAKARSCNVHVPGPGKRLYAISHHHDGDVWFVTVGKALTGRRPVWKGRKKTEDTRRIEDAALVRAIFPANGLCWVFTDGGAAAGRRNGWRAAAGRRNGWRSLLTPSAVLVRPHYRQSMYCSALQPGAGPLAPNPAISRLTSVRLQHRCLSRRSRSHRL